ncbi:MAG: cell division protein FtsQ [Bacteroidota bacterium]
MAIDKQKLVKRLGQIGIITIWVLMVSGVVVSLAFANKQENALTCKKVKVSILPQNELLFIDRDMVLTNIHPTGSEKAIIGNKIIELNIPLIETKLNHNDFIKTSEVFTDMNGELQINVIQRRPILRLLKADGSSYYIDDEGRKMPVSQAFTAHVPIASGNLFEEYKTRDTMRTLVGRELHKIATYVDKDAFWKAQIEQIFVTAESEFVLIPKVGDHTIVFGTGEDLEEKFEKLLLFYKEGLSRVGWEKYSTINLKYKNQIVCTKK